MVFIVREAGYAPDDWFTTPCRDELRTFLTSHDVTDATILHDGTDVTAELAAEICTTLAWDEDPPPFVHTHAPALAAAHNGPAQRERRHIPYRSTKSLCA